jgi:hypothetical protein
MKTWVEWNLALDGDEWPVLSPGRFIPGERASGTHWIGGLAGLRAGLGALEKNIFPCRELNTTMQYVARHHVDWAVPYFWYWIQISRGGWDVFE